MEAATIIKSLPISKVVKIRKESYKDSYWRFFKNAWKVIEPETTLKENWHMIYICEELEKVARRIISGIPRDAHLIINVPPATTKSTLITVAFPAWCWILEPSLKILTMSYASDLALIHAVKSRDIIQSNWYQDLFGGIFSLKYDVNKKSEYQNDRYGHRIAFGVGGGATGKHGDLNICDDPLNPKMAASEAETKKVNDWWDNTISNRFTDPLVAQKILVMQRLSKNDLTGHCLTKGDKYRQICLPAEKSKHIKPIEKASKYVNDLLDPVRLSRPVLEDFRVELGAQGYAGQYGQTPTAEEGNLVNPEWFGRFDIPTIIQEAFNQGVDLSWDFFIDSAFTEKTTNAPTAIMAAARILGHLYVRHTQRVWMELPELIKFIPGYVSAHGYSEGSRIFIEPKASGLPAAQMLRRYTKLNIILDTAPTTDKVSRLKACLPFMEAGRQKLLKDSDWIEMYCGELKTFPFSDYKDLTDITTMAINRTQEQDSGGEIFGMEAI